MNLRCTPLERDGAVRDGVSDCCLWALEKVGASAVAAAAQVDLKAADRAVSKPRGGQRAEALTSTKTGRSVR
jgi:hypothetical protein